MKPYRCREMEDIYSSYEWLIREKLEQLDVLSRRMFREMSTFSIPIGISQPYVQGKMEELIKQIVTEGDRDHLSEETESRR